MTFGLSDVVQMVILLIVGGLVLLLWMVIAFNKTTRDRVGWVIVVLVLYCAGVWGLYYKIIAPPQNTTEQQGKNSGLSSEKEYQERYAKAKALFDEKCKSAGERIHKTADSVEGVLLLNVRPSGIAEHRANPNWPDAGLPDEAGGEDYIRTFLSWEHQQFPPRRGYLNSHPNNLSGYLVFPGYTFVDVKDGSDIYRYTFQKPPSNELSKSMVSSTPARYAVSFRNMTDEADRAMWVAGTTVTIADTQTNETIAEHTWYSFEPGQGSRAGGRAPWGFAKTCPELNGGRGGSTRMFVDKILKPKQEE